MLEDVTTTRHGAYDELGAFLRSRRERLSPEHAGVATEGRARRVRGLRARSSRISRA